MCIVIPHSFFHSIFRVLIYLYHNVEKKYVLLYIAYKLTKKPKLSFRLHPKYIQIYKKKLITQ